MGGGGRQWEGEAPTESLITPVNRREASRFRQVKHNSRHKCALEEAAPLWSEACVSVCTTENPSNQSHACQKKEKEGAVITLIARPRVAGGRGPGGFGVSAGVGSRGPVKSGAQLGPIEMPLRVSARGVGGSPNGGGEDESFNERKTTEFRKPRRSDNGLDGIFIPKRGGGRVLGPIISAS